MLKITKFARKPFYVDVVQVTEDNMEEVAQWCMGDVRVTEKPEGAVEEKYVKVRVHRPLTERQTKAFIGDYVLYAGTGFKVYTPRAFEKSFEKVTTLTKEQADEAGIHPPIEKKPTPAMLAKSKAPDVDYRDAGSGQYVSEEYAEANPDTTVAETEDSDDSSQEPEHEDLSQQHPDEDEPGAEAERILAELEKDS
jgi:hypothetical protein